MRSNQTRKYSFWSRSNLLGWRKTTADGMKLRNFIPVFFLLISLAATGFVAYSFFPEQVSFFVFVGLAITVGVLAPYPLGEIPKTEADYVYYILAMLGVVGFYAAESIPREQVASANLISEYRREIDFFEGIISQPHVFLGRADVREIVRDTITSHAFSVSMELLAENSDCPLERDQSDWCRDRAIVGHAANRLAGFDRPTIFNRSGVAPHMVERIFSGNNALSVNFDSIEPDFLRFFNLDAVTLYEYYYLSPFSRTSEPAARYVGSPEAVVEEIGVLLTLAAENLEAELQNFDDLTDHGELTDWQIWTANLWPYFLIAALSLKLSRTRITKLATLSKSPAHDVRSGPNYAAIKRALDRLQRPKKPRPR